jgi:hypothetical protein
MSEFVLVLYPWNDINHVFTGIPPHISVLQELSVIKNKQGRLIGEFVEQVSVVLGRLGANGGRMMEENLRSATNKYHQSALETPGTTINRAEVGRTYELHFFGGEIHCLPKDWLWPRCGVFNLWRQWWIGDSVQKVPPLRILDQKDFRFFNKAPLAEEVLHERTGVHREKRRARKTWCNLKILRLPVPNTEFSATFETK